jgi:hypothetical protein
LECGAAHHLLAEEPLEVDAVMDGSWGSWVIEVKTGSFASGELKGIGELSAGTRSTGRW